MSLRKFVAVYVTFLLSGMGVFLAHLLAWMHATNGTITLNMTLFGERFLEYWAMMLLMALAPWALYVVFEEGA